VGGDARQIAIGRLGDHRVGRLAVVLGHVELLLLQPLPDDVDRDLLDLDGVGGKGVAAGVP
jgi:hypothetical protein